MQLDFRCNNATDCSTKLIMLWRRLSYGQYLESKTINSTNYMNNTGTYSHHTGINLFTWNIQEL